MTFVFGASLLAHALIIVGAVLLTRSSSPRLDISQKPVQARLVRLGKPRDKNLMPRLPTAQPSADPASARPTMSRPQFTSAANQPTRPVFSASAKSGDSAKASQARRRSLFNAFASAGKPEELPGDPNGDPEGDSDTATEGERYFGLILARARRNYGITKTIPPQELIRLKAVVVLYINHSGELIKDPEILTSSGNGQFDQDVILSLRKAAPFGPPPQDLAKALETVGVAIEATP
jgi:outer membrane biosynthesis protein TonB